MRLFDPNVEATFREYVDLQFRRHNLLVEGKEKEPEFDSVEDRMSDLWEKLDDIQRQSVNGMGSDLNWIRRRGGPSPRGRKAEEVTQAERQELLGARTMGEWHAFLHYLRVCAPTTPSANLAYLRGIAYDAIGLPAYASGFYELAADLEPANASMGVIALRAVNRADPAKGLRRAEHIVASAVQHPPAVVAMSTAVLLQRNEAEGRPIDRTYYAGVLNDAIERLQLEPPSDAGQAMTYQLAASSFEILDDLPSALRCYEEGLRLSPDHEVLLIGKGLLLYGSQTDRAVEAFRRVASNEGSPLVWPYFFLTHYSLLQKNYDESLKMGRQARVRAKTNQVRAQLFEWQAICLSEGGYPPEVVRPQFEKATSLDPANERIRKNFDAFEKALAAQEETSWEIETEETLRVERAPSMSELELLAVA